MNAVEQIYDSWGNRASTLEPEQRHEGERVFKVGYQYSVTVPDDPEQPAKVAHLYRRWGRSENPMPNMEVRDGELCVPVEDLADLILRRIPAAELAEGLWRDETVRARFVDCMAERYMGEIPDSDRRELLRKINATIHSVAVDKAIERLNHMESGARCWSTEYRWRTVQIGHYEQLFERYQNALYELREAGKRTDEEVSQSLARTTTPELLKEFFFEGMDPVVKESVGEQWTDSRNFWRDRLMEAFPEPSRDSDGTATAAANGDLPVPRGER